MGFGFWIWFQGLGFRSLDLELWASGSGFGFRVWDLGSGFWNFKFGFYLPTHARLGPAAHQTLRAPLLRVQGSGFGVQGSEFSFGGAGFRL